MLLLLVVVRKLVGPEEWGNNFILQRVVLIVQEIEITSVFVLLSVKAFKIKIDIGRKNFSRVSSGTGSWFVLPL